MPFDRGGSVLPGGWIRDARVSLTRAVLLREASSVQMASPSKPAIAPHLRSERAMSGLDRAVMGPVHSSNAFVILDELGCLRTDLPALGLQLARTQC